MSWCRPRRPAGKRRGLRTRIRAWPGRRCRYRPSNSRSLDHPVAEHVRESRDRRLAVDDVPGDETRRDKSPARPRAGHPAGGRAAIVAVHAQIASARAKGGETAVGERIERPAPEGGELTSSPRVPDRGRVLTHAKEDLRCRSASVGSFAPHSILASTLRPASSQSPKNVSVVKSPSETNSQ